MSGELLRVRIERGCSTVTVVRRLGVPSSASTWSSHSPSTTRSLRLKRVGVGLRVAPRPWLDSTGTESDYAGGENITRTNRSALKRHLRHGLAAPMQPANRIMIVKGTDDPFNNAKYVVRVLAEEWRKRGISVDVVGGLRKPTGPDVLVLPHFDRSVTPPQQAELLSQCARVVNR